MGVDKTVEADTASIAKKLGFMVSAVGDGDLLIVLGLRCACVRV